ncbi:hypothetical protein OU792_10110 [Algoriphagus sp. NF]|uniref:Uncharacterized protein n=1 Tax=Algoriphagus marincola TaxID=264027 RepID=A0ABS7N3N9_9BACT|nr:MULTISPECIES: hypothetical protein [Algoriphagus]MBY5950635.1 hypothetical protein [Algoriphagus marincola]MDE0560339.1 hypothetical protein [Algoriphagus sp. NF]
MTRKAARVIFSSKTETNAQVLRLAPKRAVSRSLFAVQACLAGRQIRRPARPAGGLKLYK